MLLVVGFDPLRLGTNPENLKWYREGELTNGRWAMAAVAGILFTDLVGLPKFWLAGAEVSSSCQAAASRCRSGVHSAVVGIGQRSRGTPGRSLNTGDGINTLRQIEEGPEQPSSSSQQPAAWTILAP